jgi:chromosomal replication initiation ATPase DnaA
MSFSQVPKIPQEHSHHNSYLVVQECITFKNRPKNRQVHDAACCRIVEAATCSAFRIATADVRSLQRCKQTIAQTRQVAMYVGLGLSLTASGRGLGRDRTTVRHACTAVEDARDDAKLDLVMGVLEASLKAFCKQFMRGSLA